MKKVNFRYVFYPFLAFLLGTLMARKIFAGNLEFILISSFLIVGLSSFCLIKKLFKPLIIILSCFIFGTGWYFVGMSEFNNKTYQDKVSVVGRISDSYSENNYSYSIILKDVEIDGEDAGNIQIQLKNCNQMPKVGSFLAFETQLSSVKPFTLGKFNNSAYRNGVKYSATVDFGDVFVTKGYQKFDEKVRIAVKNLLYKHMSEKNAATAYAVMFGDKSGIDGITYSAYKGAGVVHVLTVSGLHVGFLIGLIYGFLKLCRVNRYVNFTLTTIVIIFYAYLCSFAPSVMRAGIMGIILMLSRLLYRRYDELNSLGLAGFILCLIRPLNALDVGFLMSVFCVMAIFVLMPVFTKLFKKVVPEKVASPLAVSLAAQIGILPMLCMLGGSVNILSIIANLIIVPLFALIYPLLFVVCMLGTFISFMGYLLVVLDFSFSLVKHIILFFALGPQIALREMDFAIILLFYLIFFILSEFFMAMPKERLFVFALLILSSSLVFGLYQLERNKLNSISYISQYSQSAVILKNDDGKTMIVGDCSLIERFGRYYNQNFDVYLSNKPMTEGRYKTYENMGISTFISYKEGVYSEETLLEREKDYIVGGFVVTYLGGGTNIDGVRISFDGNEIFIASSKKVDYNSLKTYDERYDFDFVFADYALGNQDCLQVSIKNIESGDYSFEEYGNVGFSFSGGKWKLRRLD